MPTVTISIQYCARSPNRAIRQGKKIIIIIIKGIKLEELKLSIFVDLCVCVCVQPLSGVQLFATPGMQSLPGFFYPWNFPGNTRVGCHFLLQGIFLIQGLNPHLLLGRQILYHSATWEAPFSDNMILHTENHKDLKKKINILFKLINKFSKFMRYKINMHYEFYFFFIYNKPSERH